MTEFVLKYYNFEFNGQVKKQILGTAIGTKLSPPYACIFMDLVENEFLEKQSHKPSVLFNYIDDVFFIWTHFWKISKSFTQASNLLTRQITKAFIFKPLGQIIEW